MSTTPTDTPGWTRLALVALLSRRRGARDGRLGRRAAEPRAGSAARTSSRTPAPTPAPASPRSTRSAQFPAGRTRRASSAPPPTRSRTAGSPKRSKGPKDRGKNYFFGGTTRRGDRGEGDDRQADDQAARGRGRSQGDAQRLARQLRQELRAGAGCSSRTRAARSSRRSGSARTRPSRARTWQARSRSVKVPARRQAGHDRRDLRRSGSDLQARRGGRPLARPRLSGARGEPDAGSPRRRGRRAARAFSRAARPSARPRPARRCRRLAGVVRALSAPGKADLAELGVRADRVALGELALEQPQRERVLEQPLDRALQRPRAVGRVPARPRRSARARRRSARARARAPRAAR